MSIFEKNKAKSTNTEDKTEYTKFYIQDFINNFENEIKGKIFETDDKAKQDYINKYGTPTDKGYLTGVGIGNNFSKLAPRKLTKKEKVKLLLLLKETNCEANIYMSYEDILKLKKGTN